MGRVAAPALESQLVLFGEVRDMLCRRRGVLALGRLEWRKQPRREGGLRGRVASRAAVKSRGGVGEWDILAPNRGGARRRAGWSWTREVCEDAHPHMGGWVGGWVGGRANGRMLEERE